MPRAAATEPVTVWPDIAVDAPTIDPVRGRIGPLAFGAELAAARVFGRPTRFSHPGRDYCELLYAAAGFQVDFDHSRLAYAAFFVAPDALLPDPGIIFCKVRLADLGVLTWASRPGDVQALLGVPWSRDDGADESVWAYRGPVATLELEFGDTGGLKRVNVFPTAS